MRGPQKTMEIVRILNSRERKTNLYGESLGKTYYQGLECAALISRDDTTANYEGFGSDISQNVEFRFNRVSLKETNFYPEIGDIIYFDSSYYEIDNTTEVQFVGGIADNNFSIVCSTFMVRKSSLNIEERINSY